MTSLSNYAVSKGLRSIVNASDTDIINLATSLSSESGASHRENAFFSQAHEELKSFCSSRNINLILPSRVNPS